jgi:PAS domain S-box-containing protein
MKFMCGRVLSRKFNPHKPYFTKKGSFWTNSSSLLTESLSPEKRPLPNQRRCAMENYESIALIPLVSKDNIIGLIQLCDRKKDMLSLDLIEFLEDVGASIGVALSKRKMVEALEASEAKIQSIFRGAPAGIGVLIDRCLVDANKYLCDLTGFTEKELLHQPSIFIFPNEEEYLRVSTELTRQVNEKGTGNIETKFKCKDGTTKDIFLNVATLNSVQDISRITFSAIDVTEQKEIERILNQTQKMDTIGKFAGGIAHDYNNMMTVILNYLDLVECEPDLTPTFRSYLDKIRKAAQHSAIITRQLLGFARNQTINPIVIDLNKAVGDMCSMMRSLILENIKLEWNPENNLWPVKIDPVQVDQIVANLLVNAQEAIVGSGVISISTSNCSLDVKPHKNNAKAPNGDFVVLKITDNGVGMSEKVREQLFIPFFSTKDIGKNTGLGLATVYGIVKQNKGFIKVESGPEAGTTFSIYFPKTSSKLLPVVKQKTNIDQTGDETILLIDDENSIL